MIPITPPFRVDQHEARIYIADARGWSFEIILAQYGGYMPTSEDSVKMAELIVEALNAHPQG